MDIRNFVDSYFDILTSKFFKVLPMKETEEPTLQVYLDSLCLELIGGKSIESMVGFVEHDGEYMTVLSIAFALRDNPAYDVKTVRREVFHAISVCQDLKEKYGRKGDACEHTA